MTTESYPAPVDLARTPAFRLACAEVRPAYRDVVDAAGRRALLEPRVMQVLVALARRRGEVVSRDELVHCCWQDRIVGDDAINRCVGALRRQAAGWGGVSIETVARVGYCLDEAAAEAPVLVAVLPFESLSEDAGMAAFSDGVSEEILQAVARQSGLKTIGRAASFGYRGTGKIMGHVARELRATHVLDGSVRRSGARVRISAHLIECEGLTTLWSECFDREMAEAFALQDAVAEAVAQALRLALAGEAWRAA